jgi:hypothetical protein
MGRGEMNTGFWCGSLKERDNLKYISIDSRIILKKEYKRNGIGFLGLD